MKISTVAGMVAGMAVSAAAITIMYPDVCRRMMRDGKKTIKKGQKLINKIGF